ncbi:hypothetical protein [Polaromonas sp.]|jgi:hypothetical protein|uniref:hypothetical protein n=1 Tax=Polaromonas sp. TaxID=1869339 RepID=UPI0037CC997F
MDRSELLKDLQDNLKLQKLATDNPKDKVLRAEADAKAKELGLASTLDAANAALWAGPHATNSYLGEFAARGNAGTVVGSWANVKPDDELHNSQVDSLDLETTLSLAKKFDGDIDGLTATGNSTVVEGEERFVFGASYIGTRGVSINETAGLLGSFVHGKRVNWTDGDIWVRQEGGKMYKTDIDTDFVDYQANAKEKISFFRRAGKDIKHTTLAGADIIVGNSAEGYRTKNSVVGLLETSNFAGASAQFTFAGAAISSTFAGAQITLSTTGLSTAVAVSGALLAYNVAPARITVDSTGLTVQLCQNNFYNVASNSIQTYVSSMEKNGITIKMNDVLTEKSSVKLGNTLWEVVKNNLCVTDRTLAIGTSHVNIQNIKAGVSNSDSVFSKAKTSVSAGDVSVAQTGSTVYV